MKKTNNITLKQVIEKALREKNVSLNEGQISKGTTFNIGDNDPNVMIKIIAKKNGVNPSDFAIVKKGTIMYNPKKQTPKNKNVIAKPKDMSVEEYKEKMVLPNKPELKDQEGEIWRPVQNKGRYFGGDADYSNYYEISNKGRLRVINLNNALKSTISVGYDAPTRNAMQFHLNHKSGMNTCPDVKYIVADAFLGEHDLENNMVIHIDGDYHNNDVTNLKWVPRKRKSNNQTNNITENKAVKKNRMNESFETRYENAINTIEYYLFLKKNGEPLSSKQEEQVSEIVDFLKETDACDNPNTDNWIEMCEELLSSTNQSIQERKSNIEIKPENKGKFNATKKRTGKSTEELTHSKNPLTKKRAIFAQNAKKWNHNKVNESESGLHNDFITWALNNSSTQRRVGGPVNAMEAFYDYYYNNDNEALYRACEAFCEFVGIKMSDTVFHNAEKAVNAFMYYNANDYNEEEENSELYENNEPIASNANNHKISIEDILKRINDAGVNQAVDVNSNPSSNGMNGEQSSNYDFKLGSYTYHSGQHMLTGPNGSQYLSARLADLLLVLCEHMNQTLDRGTVLRCLWRNEDGFSARSMDVYINALRKLFANDPNVNIYNVRGIGFRLEVK